MQIEIQFNKAIIDKVKSLKFQVDQLGSVLFILFALYEGKIELLDEFDDSNKERRALLLYKELVLRDLLVASDDETIYVLTPKGIELIEFIQENTSDITTERIAVAGVDQLKDAVGVETWIDEWLDIFPRGIRTGGKLLRSDKGSCTRKMISFIKEYKYDKDTIFAATKAYMEAKRQEGYAFTRCATYFIYRAETSYKDKTSDLATWCEQVLHEKENPSSTENTFEILA